MLFAIIADDVPDSQGLRAARRPEHLARLEQLRDQGRLILAGPFPVVASDQPGAPGATGSLIVAEFESLAAAQAWAEADPFRTGGVYARVQVKPFRHVLP